MLKWNQRHHFSIVDLSTMLKWNQRHHFRHGSTCAMNCMHLCLWKTHSQDCPHGEIRHLQFEHSTRISSDIWWIVLTRVEVKQAIIAQRVKIAQQPPLLSIRSNCTCILTSAVNLTASLGKLDKSDLSVSSK